MTRQSKCNIRNWIRLAVKLPFHQRLWLVPRGLQPHAPHMTTTKLWPFPKASGCNRPLTTTSHSSSMRPQTLLPALSCRSYRGRDKSLGRGEKPRKWKYMNRFHAVPPPEDHWHPLAAIRLVFHFRFRSCCFVPITWPTFKLNGIRWNRVARWEGQDWEGMNQPLLGPPWQVCSRPRVNKRIT